MESIGRAIDDDYARQILGGLTPGTTTSVHLPRTTYDEEKADALGERVRIMAKAQNRNVSYRVQNRPEDKDIYLLVSEV